MIYFFSFFMCLTAYSLLSVGFVLMKKGIEWIGWKGEKNRKFYSNLFLWLAGFFVMNIYGVPSAIALKTLTPHVVSAFAGWGIIVLVFFSYFLLKEKIFRTDYIFSVLIVVGIFLLNFFEKSNSFEKSTSLLGIIFLSMIPIILFFYGFYKKLSLRIKTVIFASVSGMAAGLMVLFLRLLMLKFGYKVSLYFSSEYLYLYITFALLSFIALQFALKLGDMIVIGPTQYSVNIIYPVFASLMVFGQLINIIQVLSLGLIVYSVVNILNKH